MVKTKKPCINCKEEFTPNRRDRIYCSNACRDKSFYQKKLAALRRKMPIEKRKCRTCNGEFQSATSRKLYCSSKCVPNNKPPVVFPNLSSGTMGAVSELIVAAKLLTQGWSVFRSVSPNCFCDLVAFKEGEKPRFVEVRTGQITKKGDITFPSKLRPGTTEVAIFIPATKRVIFRKCAVNIS